jgi:glycosyltransferase involved in cell wall biosynthesis
MSVRIHKSSRVRAEDFNTDWYRDRSKELSKPKEVIIHRKLWELSVIAQVYIDQVDHGGRAVGFGVGKEPISAWLASRNAEVTATDLPDDIEIGDWSSTNQHSQSLYDIYDEYVCDRDKFDNLVDFIPVDMNSIPDSFVDYDFLWSCGSCEHIGGIKNTLSFICRSMECLRPGGVAVHTTEYNPVSNTITLEADNLVLLRYRDLILLDSMLKSQGDLLLPLDLSPGDLPEDEYIDSEPYYSGPSHLNIKIVNGEYITTSIALVIIRGGAKDQELDSPIVIERSKLKVLWVGDAIASTGFAKCTHAVCDELHKQNHEVHVLGLGYYGDPHLYPYPIHPAFQPLDYGHDLFGSGRLPHLIHRIKPDVVVILNDPWNIKGYLADIHSSLPKSYRLPPIVAWLAVDGKNQRGAELNDLYHVATWTEFAKRELIYGGCTRNISVIPLGVDHSVFYPRSLHTSRDKVLDERTRKLVDDDAFVIGVVGRNQYRKRLDLSIQVFSEVYKQIDDAYLYIHTAPTGEESTDIRSLVKYYGIKGRVILSEPRLGYGEDEPLMPYIYSAMDLYLTTSQGEGWSLTTLEAMACGVPCVAPDWSGLGDWAQSAAALVPCSGVALTAPRDRGLHTLGGVVDVEECVKSITNLHNDRVLYNEHIDRGLQLAQSLSGLIQGSNLYQCWSPSYDIQTYRTR